MLMVKQETKGNIHYLLFGGGITDEADYSTIKISSADYVIFDMNNVNHVDSKGIQKWILFLRSLPETSKFIFNRCPTIVIYQINLFPEFVGKRGAEIRSFYAPYYNENTDEDCPVLLETKKHFPPGQEAKAPKIKAADGTDLEFDGIEKSFFAFLSRNQTYNI